MSFYPLFLKLFITEEILKSSFLFKFSWFGIQTKDFEHRIAFDNLVFKKGFKTLFWFKSFL